MTSKQAMTRFLQLALSTPKGAQILAGVAWSASFGWAVIVTVKHPEVTEPPLLQLSPVGAEALANAIGETLAERPQDENTSLLAEIGRDLTTYAKVATMYRAGGHTPWSLPKEGRA